MIHFLLEHVNTRNEMNSTSGVMEIMDTGSTNSELEGLSPIGITLIVGALLFLAMHAIGPSPVPFIAPGDLFDNEPKVVASSLAASVTWIGMLIVALMFPLCQLYLKSFMLFPFIIVIVCQIVPFFFYFPETKGMPNSRIASMFQVENPWTRAIGLKPPPQPNESFCQFTHSKNSLNTVSIENLSVRTVSTESIY